MGHECDDCATKKGWYSSEKIQNSWWTAGTFNSDKKYLLWTKKDTQFADGLAVWRRATEVKLQANKLKSQFVKWWKENFANFTCLNLLSGLSEKEILEMFRVYLFNQSQAKTINLSAEDDTEADPCPDDYLPDGKYNL